jgi:hypothetical protein
MLEVMYMHVRGYVYVCKGLCICMLQVMYMYVRGYVYVC